MKSHKFEQYTNAILAGIVSEGMYIVLGLLNLWLINQILEKDDFGSFIFILAIFQILTLMGTGGLDRSLLFRISGQEQDTGKKVLIGGENASFSLITSFGYSLFLGAGIVVMVMSVNGGNIEIYQLWLLVISAALPFQVAQEIMSSWFVANKRVAEARLISQIRPFCYLCFLVVVLIFFKTRYGVAAAFLGASISTTLFWFFWAGPSNLKKPEWPGRFDVVYAVKLMFTKMAHIGLDRTDLLMLGLLAGNTATAEFAVAARLSNITKIGNKLLTPIFTPRMRFSIANLQHTDLKREYAQNRLFGFVSSFFGLVLLILFGPFLLSVFGDYKTAWNVLIVLASVQLVKSAFGPNGQYLSMSGYGTATLFTTLSLLIMCIALNWIMIPVWGTMGAAFATLLSISIIQIVISYLIKKWDDFSTLDWQVVLVLFVAAFMLVLMSGYFDLKAFTAILMLLPAGWLIIKQKKLWLPVFKEIKVSFSNSTIFGKTDQRE